MVGVENDRDSVKCGDFVDVLGGRDASSDGGGIIGVISGLSGNEETSSLGESDNDGSTVLLGGFHARVDGGSSDNIDSGDGESNVLGVVEKVNEGLSGDNTRLDGSRKLGESLGLRSGFSLGRQRCGASLEVSSRGESSGGADGGKEGDG